MIIELLYPINSKYLIYDFNKLNKILKRYRNGKAFDALMEKKTRAMIRG
ncbi:MAG: hypothetical protein Q8M95_02405 [Candidatus Methanoperedens sp.]|nr:hypothetical protein [Candidatus Methanoperedens sp.]